MSDTQEQQAISLERIKHEHRLKLKRHYHWPIALISLLIVLIIAYVTYDTWSLLYP